MGCVQNITWLDYPKQSEYVNRRVEVCFHYDTTKTMMGTIVRDDREEPGETIITLDDGRIIRGTECQFQSIDRTVQNRNNAERRRTAQNGE